MIRVRRGFTLKALGRLMGYSEGSADTRIAQFESSKRGLTKKVGEKLASILEVHPDNFSPHICETPVELYRSMVWIAKEYGGASIHKCYMDWMFSGVDELYGVIDDMEVLRREFVYEKEEQHDRG